MMERIESKRREMWIEKWNNQKLAVVSSDDLANEVRLQMTAAYLQSDIYNLSCIYSQTNSN